MMLLVQALCVVAFAVFCGIVGAAIGSHLRGQAEAFHRLQLTGYAGRLEKELAEAERIIRDLTNARLWEAEQQPERLATVPPEKWAALMEAREHPEMN